MEIILCKQLPINNHSITSVKEVPSIGPPQWKG